MVALVGIAVELLGGGLIVRGQPDSLADVGVSLQVGGGEALGTEDLVHLFEGEPLCLRDLYQERLVSVCQLQRLQNDVRRRG